MEENIGTGKPKKGMIRKLMRFLLITSVLILLGTGTLLGLLLVYQDEVKSVILSELNKHLAAEVKIDPKDIDLTIISTFPDCSIQFSNVLMLEALPQKKRDTLFYAGRLNLHFNIRDLWNQNYNIETIKIRNALIRPLVFKNGKNNYTFWKSDVNHGNGRLEFRLQRVSIENLDVLYNDKQQALKTDFTVQQLQLKGRFSDSDYELGSRGKMFLTEISSAGNTYIRNKNLDLKLALNVTNDDYTFTESSVSLNDLELELEGRFRYKSSLSGLDIRFSATDLEISPALSLLPENFRQPVSDYKSAGYFYANGRFRYDNQESYTFNTEFGINNGIITYIPNAAVASGVQLKGSLDLTPQSSALLLKDVKMKFGEESLAGNCIIRDFKDPAIDLDLKASLDLAALYNFWPVDTLTSVKGHVEIDVKINGLLKDLRGQAFSDKVNLDLIAGAQGIEAGFKGDEKVYTVESCTILARDREVEVKDLLLKRGSSDILLSGKMPGLFNHLMDRSAPLVIHGNLRSEYIAMEDFIGARQGTAGGNNEPLIPPNVSFKLDALIKKFTLGKFEARNISGDLEIRNQKAIVNEMKFNAMDGDAVVNAFADNSKGRLDVVIRGDLNEINISLLFAQLNNFGQSTLTDKNIKGFVTAGIDFSGRWNNNLEADPSSILASCDIGINRGELLDFRPLLSLSKFVDITELQRISFSRMQNRVEIRNSAIVIPRTSINNSALDIEFSGTHYFDNRIDYHFKLLLSELLSKKRKKPNDEFGPVAEDPGNRRCAFLLMTGTVDNPVMKYDRQGLKEKIREDIRQEKQNIRQILKDELISFKKTGDIPPQATPRTQEPALELPARSVKPAKTLELKKREEDEDF